MSVRPTLSTRGARALRQDEADPTKKLLLVIALLAALPIAMATAWLVWLTGTTMSTAVLAGGGTFASSTLLILRLIQFLKE